MRKWRKVWRAQWCYDKPNVPLPESPFVVKKKVISALGITLMTFDFLECSLFSASATRKLVSSMVISVRPLRRRSCMGMLLSSQERRSCLDVPLRVSSLAEIPRTYSIDQRNDGMG